MTYKLAIDFGTTNSVVACWDEDNDHAKIIALPNLSQPEEGKQPPLIPSLVYVENGQQGQVSIGQAVRDSNFDQQSNNRLFRNFKRGIVATPAPAARRIDGTLWADRDAGQCFLHQLVKAIPYQTDQIEQLVLTTPVASFENYLQWLQETLSHLSDKIHIVDESTAAALGYTVTEPEAIVLVFDFGGGTLDLSLVKLPISKAKTGGILSRLLKIKEKARQHTAKVIAKAGRIIGGSDIDQWLLAYVLNKTNLSIADLGDYYTVLLTQCEQAKITLSTAESADLNFSLGSRDYQLTITRSELEQLMEENGFFTALRRVVDKVMYVARQRTIYREDINYVLMVGGTSLMPSVQQTLKDYFSDMAVRSDKPFTAIAEGALQVALGSGLEDYLIHSYGLRHLDPDTKQHQYDEIIPMGSIYPSEKPVEVLLGAAHPNQKSIEFIIGEIDTDAVAMVEVQYQDGQAVFVAQANRDVQQIVPLNEGSVEDFLAHLNPNANPGTDRLKATFSINSRRQLLLTVLDIQTNQQLLDNVPVVTLR